MREVEQVNAQEGLGFEGCRHATRRPGGKRQVLLLDGESLHALGLPPGTLKENVLLRGVALGTLPLGQRLRLGEEVVVELVEACVPCWKLEKVRPGLLEESCGRRGVLARVLRSGQVEVGAGVALLDSSARW